MRLIVKRLMGEHLSVTRTVTLVAAVVTLFLGLIVAVLLGLSNTNQSRFEDYYSILFWINIAAAFLLLSVVVILAIKLIYNLRQRKFGSKLLLKLAVIFSLLGFLPGLLIYYVSYQFVSRSIESWFNVEVEAALNSGVNLARASIGALGNDLGASALMQARQLAQMSSTRVNLSLENVREQLKATDVQLWSNSGQLLASVSENPYSLAVSKPSALQFRQAANSVYISYTTGLEDALDENARKSMPAQEQKEMQVFLHALVQVPSPQSVLENSTATIKDQQFLQVIQPLPKALLRNISAVENAYQEYQTRALGREGLKRMYIGTLTLSLFLSVLGALIVSVVIGLQLVRPLLILMKGMQQVSLGDLSQKIVLHGKDDISALTGHFAEMTAQLLQTRQALDASLVQIQASRENVQAILDSLSSGVMVLKDDGVILSINPSAYRLLKLDDQIPVDLKQQNRLSFGHDELVGQNLQSIRGLDDFAQFIYAQFKEFNARPKGNPYEFWEQTFTLHANEPHQGDHGAFSANHGMNLVVRGMIFKAEIRNDAYLVVFDDISHIVSVQRVKAWGEVARRLAHEIKNPLTPIQLAAQRLQKRLSSQLNETEKAILDKSVMTIVEQVQSMQRLVNEFRDYARLPSAEMKLVQLNEIIRDIAQLYVCEGSENMELVLDLDENCPKITLDAQQMRQVLHNLLQNAQDANKEAQSKEKIVVKTAYSQQLQQVVLTICDHGKGFEPQVIKRAFEPYITTKAHGTGLGLAVVKKILDEHAARIELLNIEKGHKITGAQVVLSFKVPEN